MKYLTVFILSSLMLFGCTESKDVDTTDDRTIALDKFFSYHADQQFTGGIQVIPVTTPKGTFNVWTKRVGNNPKMRVLLLHGGPGASHELYESFEGYLPKEGIEFIYYDQLGSYYSDQPSDTSLWTTDRFVEEVEQVRKALGLDASNFYLFGQSWGGILAMEYALKYQDNLKGLIISNMMSSIPEYNTYAEEVLAPQLPAGVLKNIKAIEANNDFSNPQYEKLLMEHFYPQHVLRMPLEKWPESINRTFKHLNPKVYVYMQGYSEFGITGDATLKDWDIKDRLKEIKTPTLVIGAQHDTMNPEHMEWMSKEFPNGRFLLCSGGHFSQYDDQETFFPGLIQYIREVDNNNL